MHFFPLLKLCGFVLFALLFVSKSVRELLVQISWNLSGGNARGKRKNELHYITNHFLKTGKIQHWLW